MLRIDTSNPQSAYIGNPTLFSSAPPIDFAHTDSGYMGSQHVFFLRTPYGNINVDSKRGKVFNIQGKKAIDISGGISKFLGKYLPFEIKKTFPDIDIDNNYKGIGLHGVYDDEHKRFLLSKLDYKPIKKVALEDGKFVQRELSENKKEELANKGFIFSKKEKDNKGEVYIKKYKGKKQIEHKHPIPDD